MQNQLRQFAQIPFITLYIPSGLKLAGRMIAGMGMSLKQEILWHCDESRGRIRFQGFKALLLPVTLEEFCKFFRGVEITANGIVFHNHFF